MEKSTTMQYVRAIAELFGCAVLGLSISAIVSLCLIMF